MDKEEVKTKLGTEKYQKQTVEPEEATIPYRLLVDAFVKAVDQPLATIPSIFFTSLELVKVIIRSRAYARAFDLAHVHTLDFARDLVLDVARAHARDIYRALDLNLNHAPDDGLARALDLALTLARDFDFAINLDRARISDLYLARDVNRPEARDLYSVNEIDSIHARVRALESAHALGHALDHALEHAITLARLIGQYLDNESSITNLKLTTDDSLLDGGPTPSYLDSTIIPYLKAIAQLQQVFDRLAGQESSQVRIASVVRGSLDISFDGAARAIEVILDTIVPWRRKHAQTIAKLNEQEKRIAVKKLEGEAEAGSETAAAKAREEVRKLQLENEKLQVELHEKRIDLALKVIDKLNPELPQAQKIGYVIQLLEPIKVITESPLQLADSTGDGSEGE